MNELLYHTRNLPYGTHGEPLNNITATGLICLQEVLHGQLVDILTDLNGTTSSAESHDPPQGPLWAYLGVGRDDGQQQGEYSPVIYSPQILRVIHWETVWLSPTPSQPSKGWDASSIRILTAVVFQHRATNARFIFCNTHLDDAGSESRKNSIPLILGTIKRFQSQWGPDNSLNQYLPVVLAGDFNSKPEQEAYKAMEASQYLDDAYKHIDVRRQYGDHITFTGFEPDKDKEEQGRIDFVWLGPASKEESDPGAFEGDTSVKTGNNSLRNGPWRWKVDGYAVLPNLFEDGVYASDHRAVVADLSLVYM